MNNYQDSPPLLRLAAGAEAPPLAVRMTGTLISAGNCLAMEGGGTTVVVWARGAEARSPGSGNVVVIWPRTATPQGGDGWGTVVVVWPRTIGAGTPVRVGERVELVGDMKDDVSGLRLERPAPPGCGGRAFVVREFRPAPAETR